MSAETTPGAAEPTQRVARNTIFSLASQLTSSLLTVFITLFLVRALTSSEFGMFSLALSLGGLVAVPADFGVAAATARYVADHRADRGRVAGVLADGLKLKLLTSAFFAVALFLAAGPIASSYHLPGLSWSLRAVAIAMFGQGVVLFFMYAFNSGGEAGATFSLVFVESMLEAGATLAFVVVSGGAAAAMFGRAFGYGVGAVVGVALAIRLFGRLPLRRRIRGEPDLRAIGAYAGAALVVNAAYTAFAQIDVMLIGGFLGATAAGLFQAPLRMTAFLQYPAAALSAAATPRLARGAGQQPDVRLFVRAIRYVAIIQAFLVVPAIVWSEPIMNLVAPSYDRSAAVLRGLAPFIYLSGFAVLFSLAANYLGEVRRRIPVGIVVLLLNLVIDVILIPRIGILGGAIGTDVAFAVFVPGHVWICLRHIELPRRILLISLLRTTLAGAAMALVLAAVGTGRLSTLQWLAGGVAGPAAFAVAILALREISPAELAWLRNRGRRA